MDNFNILIHQVSIPLKRYIYYRINDSFVTDDLYQEIVTKAWKNVHTLQDEVKFKSWIFQIARNMVNLMKPYIVNKIMMMY